MIGKQLAVTEQDKTQAAKPDQSADRPANQDVEQHGEKDDGHSGGNGNQNNLAALTGD